MFRVVYIIMVLSFTPHKPDAHWVPAGGVYLTIKECRENLGPPARLSWQYGAWRICGGLALFNKAEMRSLCAGKSCRYRPNSTTTATNMGIYGDGEHPTPWNLPEQGRM
jgi:hypothetical protein